MRKQLMGLILGCVVFGFSSTAFADGLTCNDERGCKLCSAIAPGNFRDTVTVAETWSTETCRAYAASIGANNWQLACMNKDSFTWGGGSAATGQQSVANPIPIYPPGDLCGW